MNYLVGLSGGLDSTWAVRVLLEGGHTVEGLAIKFSDHTDIESAERSASELGIKLHIADEREHFKRAVIGDFLAEYSLGRTPNPCVVCNRFVKIAALVRIARELGFDRAATGHYCRVGADGGRYFIERAQDERKDQSYMLWGLTQAQLSMLDFPLAELNKTEVRAGAASLGYSSAGAGESQEICFIPSNDHAAFIEDILGRFPEGDFVTEDGRVLGRHRGIIRYTVGQRKGLGISYGEPLFVTKIDAETNRITVAPSGGGMTDSLFVRRLNFQRLPEDNIDLGRDYRFMVKIRYAAPPVPCTVSFRRSDGKISASVRFDAPLRAPSPGQSAVFYSPGERYSIEFGGIVG